MKIRTWAALAALALTPALARAQQSHPIEFGVDAGISVTDDDPKITTVALPVNSLRVGFYVTDRVAIEPSVTFNYTKSGGSSFSRFAPELGLLFDLTESREAPQFFLRPFAGLERLSLDGGTFGGTDAQTVPHLGAGVGVKIPFRSIERFAWRIEALYDHGFEKDNGAIPAVNTVGLKLGLSFFTK